MDSFMFYAGLVFLIWLISELRALFGFNAAWAFWY